MIDRRLAPTGFVPLTTGLLFLGCAAARDTNAGSVGSGGPTAVDRTCTSGQAGLEARGGAMRGAISLSVSGDIRVTVDFEDVGSFQNPQTFGFDRDAVAIGEHLDKQIRIQNVSTMAALNINSAAVVYTPEAGEAVAGLALVAAEGHAGPIAVAEGKVTGICLDEGETLTLTVRYTRPADQVARSAAMLIVSDTKNEAERELQLSFEVVHSNTVAALEPR